MPQKKSKQAQEAGPKAKTLYTIKLDDEQMDQLADYLRSRAQGAVVPL